MKTVKTLALLPCCLLLIASAPALAMDAKYCESQGTHLIGTEHAAFMKSCLTKMGSQVQVEELTRKNKKLYCENNAKNKALADNEKTSYIAICMEKNEAAEALATPPAKRTFFSSTDTAGDNTLPKTSAANTVSDNTATPQKISTLNTISDTTATSPKISPANVTSSNTAIPPEATPTQIEIINSSCDQNARQKGLRGNARKQFITACEEEVDLARYKLAGDELKKHKRNDALWYKAFAEANGEVRVAEAAYIRMRVNQMRRCCTPVK